MPMSRKEFKAALSKMSRSELIDIICDIYYGHEINRCDDQVIDTGCSCNCSCESTQTKSTKSPKVAKEKLSAKKK